MANYRQERGASSSVPGGDRRSHISYGGEPSRNAVARAGQRNKKGLLGLSNLGNTCFMNAALQCLSHTHGMQKYFRFCSHAYAGKAQSSRQKLLMAFAHWFERDWSKSVSANYHSPEDILRCVQQLNPTFQGYSQQDSQEFLRCVLDNIHEELRREVPDDLSSLGIGSRDNEDLDAGSQPAQFTPSSSSSFFAGPAGEAVISTSATQNLMQLCQTPEGTDAGEIRLPPRNSSAKFPSDSGTSTSTSPPEGSKEGDGDSTSSEPSEVTKTHFESIVSELFQGRVVSCVRCLECRKTSRTQEAFFDISVPIPNANETGAAGGESLSPASPSIQRQGSGGLRSSASWSGVFGGLGGKVKSWFYDKGADVSDCLRRYCSPEYLVGRDQYYCERCKRKNDCEKRMVFKDLPEVLCIHIKRFRYDNGWFNGSKNSRVVTFPVTSPLDVGPFLEEPSSQPVEYRLIGLIQHIGSMGGGHYISYCQHKRRPQDWYEFDDMQANLVSAEQVERAEPYVLFYQRVPSKGTRLDRQTFKQDMRRMQAQIQDYLMSSALATPSASSTARPSNDDRESITSLPQMAAQAVAEEIRHHGPALRNLYRSPAQELDMVFVSKHWYVRLTTMSHPGPIDNHEYMCPHKMMGYSSAEIAAEPFIPISRSLFQSLVGKYGGGPEISSLEVCPRCQVFLSAYNTRKQFEYELVTKYDTKDTGDGEAWYLVDALWVNSWKQYVKSEQIHDIREACAPGRITNERLFETEDPSALKPKLRLRLDYIGVNARVWWLFMHAHGGGPAIVREDLDAYSQTSRPEKDLIPEELRAEGNESVMRSTWQFADECKGDLQLYQQKYGGVASFFGLGDQEQLEDPPQEPSRPGLPSSKPSAAVVMENSRVNQQQPEAAAT
eukprot:TRINITY_DN9314_c0_g1_i1.p1 TRINITY_DN9314_c0_g1~~TRINITY_DN9314_c0_g1_i1.p1  ORF type:complete len:920 (-),score=147.92 TRINITY_DN9314_c0_g1_i1:275-2944(-)